MRSLGACPRGGGGLRARVPPMPIPDGPAGLDHGASGCGQNIGSPPHPVHSATPGTGAPGDRAPDVRRLRLAAPELTAGAVAPRGAPPSASIAGPAARRAEPAPSHHSLARHRTPSHAQRSSATPPSGSLRAFPTKAVLCRPQPDSAPRYPAHTRPVAHSKHLDPRKHLPDTQADGRKSA
jgi:hypothetical protein